MDIFGHVIEMYKTSTCLITVFGVNKGMLPVKYFYSNKASVAVSKGLLLSNTFTPTRPLFISIEYHGDHKTVTKMR